MATLEVGVFNAPRDIEKLQELASSGVTRAVFNLPAVAPEIVIDKLDKYAGFIGTV